MLGDALPCSMGKSTISTGPCSIAMSQITREYIHIFHIYIYIYSIYIYSIYIYIFHIYIFHIYSIYIPYIFHIYSIYIYIFHIYIPYIFHIYIYMFHIYIYSVYILCIYIYIVHMLVYQRVGFGLYHIIWCPQHSESWSPADSLGTMKNFPNLTYTCMYVCMYPTSKTHCNPWPQNTFSFSRMVLKPA